MADLTGKAVSELPEITSISDSDLIAVSHASSSRKMTLGTLLGNLLRKTGGTMTGTLYMDNMNVIVDSPDMTIGTRPSANAASKGVLLRDSGQTTFGRFRGLFAPDGRVGSQLVSERTVNGSTVYNNIGLYVNEAGVPSVGLTQTAAWREALGLGTSGALPITVGQGGTGQTAVTTTNAISSIATAATGCAITSASFAQWGKMAMVFIVLTKTTESSISGAMQVATMVSGKRPPFNAPLTTISGTLYGGYIRSDGSVMISGTNTANQTISLFATYLLA